MTRRAACTAFALAVAGFAAAPARVGTIQDEEREGRGALGVLRRDGILFPFASFNRDSWQITWPIGLTGLTLPPSLSAIPDRWWGTRAPEKWRVRLTTGEEAQIAPRTPVVFPVFCSRRVGVRTTYQSAQPAVMGLPNPYPKDGLAITGDVAIEAIESVNTSSPEGAELLSQLLTQFDNVEEATIRGVRNAAKWRHPIERRERNKFPLRLEGWYRSPSSEPGWTVSYVEVARQYPPGPEDKGCGLETLVSGWLHHENGKLKEEASLRGKITYCDRVGATYMLPFGRIKPSNKWYWIYQLSGWEAEWYQVAEIGRERVRHVIEVPAGSARCFER
jgi:hypothetical protein